MLVVNRFRVPAEDGPVSEFTGRAEVALATLAGCRGYRSGQLGRGFDDPTEWTLVTDWESVGAYRRALSTYDVKVSATPLLAESRDEPSAFEVLARAEPGGPVTGRASDRAADPAFGDDRVAGA